MAVWVDCVGVGAIWRLEMAIWFGLASTVARISRILGVCSRVELRFICVPTRCTKILCVFSRVTLTVAYRNVTITAPLSQYTTVHYSTIQYNTVQYSTIQYTTVQ
jgi:hypothetical protein